MDDNSKRLGFGIKKLFAANESRPLIPRKERHPFGERCSLPLFLSLSLYLPLPLYLLNRLDPCSIMEMRAKTCSKCEKKIRKKHYHATQWNKQETEESTCKKCSTHLECSACGNRLSKDSYRSQEWTSKTDKHPCAECFAKMRSKSKLALVSSYPKHTPVCCNTSSMHRTILSIVCWTSFAVARSVSAKLRVRPPMRLAHAAPVHGVTQAQPDRRLHSNY